jgi:hypothetical protein
MMKHFLFARVGWMDIISSFPFQTLKMDAGLDMHSHMKGLQMLRFLQVVRIIKVMRAIKSLQTAFFKLVNDTFGSMSLSISVYTMRMTKLLTMLVITAHVCACVWYMFGKPVVDLGVGVGIEEDDDGWVSRYYPELVESDDKMALYLHAFYFVCTTMTTVGYGDISPKRHGEIIFAMVVQYLGVAIVGYIVGLMGSEVSGLGCHEGPIDQKIDFLEAIMDKHRVRKEVRHRVRKQYRAMKETAQLFMAEEVLSDLPHQMRRDLTLSVYRRPATTYEMIAGYPADYVAEIMGCLMPYHAVKDDVLLHLGQHAEELYFVDDGEVNIQWEDLRIPKKIRPLHCVHTVGSGHSFGDEGLLEAQRLPKYVYTASAANATSLFYVKTERVAQVLDVFPDVKSAVRKMINQKLARWQSATLQTLRENSAAVVGQEQYTYEPHGSLPLPQFGSGGQAVVVEGQPNEVLTASEDGPAKMSDVRRLEEKLDNLTKLMAAAQGSK